jgi:hypothetical protein
LCRRVVDPISVRTPNGGSGAIGPRHSLSKAAVDLTGPQTAGWRPGSRVYRRFVTGPFDRQWAVDVCAVCDPVFSAADVGFVRQPLPDYVSDVAPALLWEADPLRFAERYPDSGVVRSYGDQWPPPCIDYWVYVDAETGKARLSVEGWSLGQLPMDLTGDGARDGVALAEEFARILRVATPQP